MAYVAVSATIQLNDKDFARLAAAEGFVLLTTKETKLPAENFSIKVWSRARTVLPEKFVRLGITVTEK
ncbi:hypothetical protein DHW03_15965 [Pedobacter yonginense]|uniref:Uncharacterized protein n=1 Tax=Pedobacter yonginense TaxID=651869 RepID=A0A317EKA6_9SPHI|nr:hypothetical protein DHW03_15965 [Pedobacter yonginense]